MFPAQSASPTTQPSGSGNSRRISGPTQCCSVPRGRGRAAAVRGGDRGRRKILVASAKGSTGEAYLIDWNLAATIFDVKQLNEKVATSPLLAQLMGVSRNGNVIVTALGTAPGSSANSVDDLNQSCLIIEETEGDNLKQLANDTKCADSAASGDRIGWNTVAMDASGSMIAAANQFNNKGVIIERSETSYKRIADDRAMEEFATVAISKDGKTIVLGSKDENIAIWTKREDSRFEREYSGTIDSSCVRVYGPQHRVSAISFYGNSDANFLVGTQEGCLAFFEKGVSGWKPQLIDTQMPDVITASISPDFRWAAIGTASGRIQIWDLSHSIRPPAIVDARLPWSSTFAWLSLGDNADGKWMIFGNSRFGPVGAWLIQDNPVHQSPTVSRIFPPIWVDKNGIVAVSALNGSLLAATTDGRLLQFNKVDSPQAIVDRLIDRACEISRPSRRRQGLSSIDGETGRRRIHFRDHELVPGAMRAAVFFQQREQIATAQSKSQRRHLP